MTDLMCFSDGIRQVDYIIAFRFTSPSDEAPFKDFLTNLLQSGVNIEIEADNGEPAKEFNMDTNVHAFGENKLIFARLHVKWESLLRVAESLHFRKPIDSGDKAVYAPFSIPKKSTFKGFSENNENFFTPLERILAAEFILNQGFHPNLEFRMLHSPKEATPLSEPCGIEELLKKKVILATFSLHEPKADSHRSELMKTWASRRKILTPQKFDSIRDYFGEKVAFSFAWIEFYIWSFLFLFVTALVISLIPVFLRSRPLSISKEVCVRNSTTFIMCPLCKAKGCRFERLNKFCGDIVWSYFFDSPASVFLAFIAPIFGSLCLRLWSYQQSKLAHSWHVENYKAAEEPTRRRFMERLRRKNNSLSNETSLPLWSFKVPVIAFTWSTTTLLVFLAIGLELVTGIFASHLEVYFTQSESQFCNKYASYLAFGIKTLFNASCVCILSSIYRAWIQWSTNLEFHHTQDQEAQSILKKSCLMEFINVFLSLFTSILFRALNYGYPGQTLALLEPLEWPVWTGMFGVFYETYIKCTVIVFVKSVINWLPLRQVKKTVNDRVRLLFLGRRASPQRMEIQSPSSSPTYSHCLDNFNLEASGEHLLFRRQFDMCIFIGFAVMFLPASFTWILTLLLLSILTVVAKTGLLYRNVDVASSRDQLLCNHNQHGSIMGYTDFSLSYMDVNQFEISDEDKRLLKGSKFCRYFGYREPPDSTTPYSLSSVFWHILAAKFIFIFIFVLSVMLINWLLSYLVPDAHRKGTSVAVLSQPAH
ncbi:Anoctamin-5 [Taenia crassiceps]|uniref:Anoctamin n=1 Tax=Taenia crassiceps TaxID=6207 RepID=A0ABR4Q0G1_9CEST